jgi:transcriptional regulator with XRE-family HTH domain
MTIGDRIRKFRETKNMSTYKLSELTGIPQSTISKLENGKRKSDNEVLVKIADALKISIERLTGEAVSSIIEERLEESGMTLEDIASKSRVPLYWLQNIDTFIPGEFGGENEIGYSWITKVAEVLGLPGSTLRAALARQEIPSYDGPIGTPEEDFFDVIGEQKPTNYEQALTKNQKNLISNYNKLNDIGQHEAIKRVEELTYIDKYKKVQEHLILKAAHEIDGALEEDKQHDYDLMDDDNF